MADADADLTLVVLLYLCSVLFSSCTVLTFSVWLILSCKNRWNQFVNFNIICLRLLCRHDVWRVRCLFIPRQVSFQ